MNPKSLSEFTDKKKQNINILDLFSGIGGFSKGFQDAGFTIDKHYFSEIDKHAIAVYKHNFKNAIYAGSVDTIQSGDIERPDIITFGSPCQDFSLAGKRKGLEGERSSLILHAIRLISDLRPDFFIWENVKGTFSSNAGADFWAILQAFTHIGGYRLEWQLLNTKWFLPQNRERIYLIGHLATSGRSFRPVFPIGEDDQLPTISKGTEQRRAQTKYNSTTLRAGTMKATDTFIKYPKIAGTLTGGGNSGGLHSDMTTIQIKSATSQGYEEAQEGDSINFSNINSETRRGRVGKGVAQTIDTQANQGVMIGGIRGRNPENPTSRKSGEPLKQTLEINKNGTSNTLTSVQKDNVVLTKNYMQWDSSGKGYASQQDRAFYQDGHMGTIPSNRTESKLNVLLNDMKIRRLTEIECERLQGFPDNWTKFGNYDGEIKEVPKTQRYKQLGNAVTVRVVEEIARKLKQTNKK